ncbi:MAG: hypothetical protein H0V11_00785 [Actinobacteria bacterium]|nr:hypothetical protein [Actinomycetota bacterium]
MDDATSHPSRGLNLILEHCARLGEGRPPIASRLEQRAGRELSRLLLKALAGDHRARARLV